jgi:hypothetical protein
MKEGKTNTDKLATNERRNTETTTIPVVKEDVMIDKRERITGQVTVTTHTDTRTVRVPLNRTDRAYREVRVPVNKVIESVPEARQEDDRYIIPVVREEEVVVKRLVLVEELHLISDVTTTQHTEEVELREQTVFIDRTANPEK